MVYDDRENPVPGVSPPPLHAPPVCAMTRRRKTSRREWLKQASQVVAAFPLLPSPVSILNDFQSAKPKTQPATQRPQAAPQQPAERAPLFENDPTKYRFTRQEEDFLEDIQRTSFQF